MEATKSNGLKILLIESNAQDSASLMTTLSESGKHEFRISHVENLGKGLESLKTDNWDVVLLNLTLSDNAGIFSLEKVLNVKPQIAVIIINGPDDDSLAAKCMEAGAQGYLTKSQFGTKGVARELQMALARTHYLFNQVNSVKKHSMADMAKDLGDGLAKPLAGVQQKLSELKTIVTDPHLDRDQALQLLESAEEISKGFQVIISELKMVTQDADGEDPNSQVAKGRKRLLVVDDEPDIVSMLVRRLKRLGYEQIDTAANGQEAYNICIEKLNRGVKFDTIISDWNMPKLSGIELLTKIRENVHLKDTPFMMLTAVDDVQFIKNAAQKKVSQYLVKPFKPDEFDRKVSYLLRKASGNV